MLAIQVTHQQQQRRQQIHLQIYFDSKKQHNTNCVCDWCNKFFYLQSAECFVLMLDMRLLFCLWTLSNNLLVVVINGISAPCKNGVIVWYICQGAVLCLNCNLLNKSVIKHSKQKECNHVHPNTPVH
eukprot:m.177341 g.177341  ORF g.177341 m.177341 type:complete len:127 (-) comp13545_c2_seq14:1632-2012(-)